MITSENTLTVTLVYGAHGAAQFSYVKQSLSAQGFTTERFKSLAMLKERISEQHKVIIVAVGKSRAVYRSLIEMCSHHNETQFLVLTSLTLGDKLPANWWTFGETPSLEELLLSVSKALIIAELSQQNISLRYALADPLLPVDFPTRSPAMREISRQAVRVAKGNGTVLILGESGTGKSAFARYIHQLSPRASGPFVSLSCASLPRELLEAELFGYEKGAFTGATMNRPGLVEVAHGGTLFLDEIGDLPYELQPKLLTFLQDKTARRLGSTIVRTPDIRIIAATNRDLKEGVQTKQFREDLFYRLSVFTFSLLPLRERMEDIALIAEKALNEIAPERRVKLGNDALEKMAKHHWPGNIRELRNVLERAALFSNHSTLRGDDIFLEGSGAEGGASKPFIKRTLAQIEKSALKETLDFTNNNKRDAAEILGLSLKTIYNLIHRHGL